MNRRLFLFLAVAVLLSGILIRLAVHSYFGLDSDDMYSLTVARHTPAEIVTGLFQLRLDIHPPLHYLTLLWWTQTVGNSLISLRSLNLLLDLMTAAALIRVSVRLYGRRGGLTSGLLWTVAPLLIFTGYLTRMYTLMTMFTTLGVWCAMEATFTNGKRRMVWVAVTALFGLGAMYTHSIGVLVYAAMLLALLVAGLLKHHDRWRNTFITLFWFAIAGLVSLPYTSLIFNYYRSGKRLGAQFSFYKFENSLELPGAVISALTTHRVLNDRVFALVLPLVFVTLSIVLWRRYRNQIVPLIIMIWFAIAAIAMMAGLTRIYKPFYFTAFTPVVLAFITGSLMLIRQRNLKLIGTVGVVLVFLSGTINDLDRKLRDDPLAAAQFIADHERPGDLVVVTPDWAAELFRYHFKGKSRVQGVFGGVGRDIDLDTLLPFVSKDADGLWVVRFQMPATDPENLLDKWFTAHAIAGTRIFPTNTPVSYYDLAPLRQVLPDYARPLDANFGDIAALRGVYLPVRQGSARDTRLHPPSNWVQVVLYWETLKTGSNFTPRVRFTDGYGQVFGGSVDAEPDATVLRRFPVSTWQIGQLYQIITDLNLNPDTPPGAYNIEVTVLDPSGQQLPANGSDAGVAWVIAGQFVVR